MRTVSYRIDDLKKAVIHIGKVQENEATRVQIDAGPVFAEYSAAVPSMKIVNPAGTVYQPTVTRDGDSVLWTIKDSDLVTPGQGELQLTFTENGVVVKSCIGKLHVDRSIVAGGTAPDPVQEWLDHAEEVLEEIETAFPEGGTTGQVLAKKSNDDYDTEWVDQGAGGVSDYDDLENRPQIGGVTLTGDKSLHDLGAAAESDIPDVSGFYTKPAGGIPASDIADGVIPDPASIINDTSTAADKVWSASKTNELKSAITQKYTKPNDGIPKSDLASAVQASLGKADTALQGEDIETAVDTWLDENITNPDSPPLDRSLSSSSAAAPADILGGLMAHESYGLTGSDIPTVEYVPVDADATVSGNRVTINAYDNVAFSSPTSTDAKIYPVTSGKTYKVIGYSDNTKNRPVLVVADSKVTSGAIATAGNYDYQLGTESTAQAQEIEYTALRTGYMYLNTNSSCGLWEKVVTPAASRKYYMDDIRNVNLPLIASGLNKSVFREKTDSASALVKQVPRNAESFAKVTSVADSVTLVRSIVSRNILNKNNVGDVVVDAEGTEKVGIQTIHVPAGNYYVILGNVGNYTMVKKVENGIYTTLYKDQFPMKLGITDPAGGYFIVYASSLANLGDISGVMIGLLKDDESTLSFEAYAEKTYTPEALEVNPYIEVVPRGFIEFANSGNTDVSSTVKYLVSGKDDDTTTSKDFMVSPNGTKFLPMVKNDGTLSLARVVPKKALFIGNSLTSGWQTFGETATESSKDFVSRFSAVVYDMDSDYTFSRKWATGFEQQTSLANAQSWTATNIDPLLTSDLDLIVVQLCENVVGNASMTATFPSSSLWLMQHLRETCPKARVVWMGLWFERGWTKTLLDNTKKAGCEYIDIRKLYTPENIGYIGLVYKMDSDYTKEYTVDSFVVDDGEITLNFTVDGTEYTATIPSYTSYTSESETSITVTGIYHVANTYYASIHPGDEGFRKIANKMLFDLGISDSEETIPADE